MINTTLGWKLLNRYWQVKDKLFPPGTRRRKLYGSILIGITGVIKRTGNRSIISAFLTIVNRRLPRGTTVKEVLREVTVPSEDATISIVIPVKNAGECFRDLLRMLSNQKGFKDIEIIVVDSGSTDRTHEIAREFRTKFIKISPEEFSHSYARNLGAERASGDYLLFTVQDALPPSNLWLRELFIVIKGNEVAAVSCAEYFREDADLFYRALLWDFYKFLELDKQDRIMCKPDDENYLTLRKNGQMSNIACLISREVFLRYGFRGNYAEDLDLGVRLISDGYKLAFLSSTRIIHSHNRPAYYHLKRGYVDNLAMPQIIPGWPELATEVERLFRDIIFTYEVVNSIVYNELQQIGLPCTIGELSTIVTEKFRSAVKLSYPPYIEVASNGLVDCEFTSFLQGVSKLHYLNGKKNSRYDGILVHAMQNFTRIIFEYMDDTYELIDDDLLEGFLSGIYKAYAFQCGAHLADCFFRGSECTKEKLKEINNELTTGI